MTRLFLKLNMINDIYAFHKIAQKISGKVYLQQSQYLVNAKSLMGILSLDLTKIVTFICEENISDEIIIELNKFSVE